ncbi:transcriptional regulator [Streptomyces mutabilis]|uniref:Transcriptional regulator n=2 Tax=Streptomyces mutabilis TaxID=67332 RepID=A0A086MQG4_9ACTN|nr:transcriptional regulator [Streptomyces mutabilis]
MLAAGAALGAGALAVSTAVWAAPAPRLSAGDVAAGRRLFAAGAYTRLDQVLPPLLEAAARSAERGPAGAALAADVWVLASQLAVKQGATEAAGAYAAQAGATATRSGDPVVLAAAARAAATPLRRTGRTGRTDEALHLLHQARTHLMAGARPTAAELEAAGMAALTAAYTAAQAHRPALARDFAAQAEEDTLRLARHPHTAGRPRELTAGQCALYGIGIHRHLGDVDTARALLDAGDAAGAFAQLRLVEAAAPLEARRPAVRALTARVAELRPDLPGLHHHTQRTVVSPL